MWRYRKLHDGSPCIKSTGAARGIALVEVVHSEVPTVAVGYVDVVGSEGKLRQVGETVVGRPERVHLASLTRHHDGCQLASAA
jgi:hypothetical protein